MEMCTAIRGIGRKPNFHGSFVVSSDKYDLEMPYFGLLEVC